MEYVHVKNIDLYHPGYKDRNLIWAKIHFSMASGDPEFEMMDETDKWRFICFIILELQSKKPIPLDDNYLKRKGFNLKKRPISMSLQMLHNFIDIVTEENNLCVVEKSRVEKSRVEKSREESVTEVDPLVYQDDEIKVAWEMWKKYKYEQFNKFVYKSQMSEQMGINKLEELCNGNTKNAMLIVKQSVTNGWKGLFELKTGNAGWQARGPDEKYGKLPGETDEQRRKRIAKKFAEQTRREKGIIQTEVVS